MLSPMEEVLVGARWLNDHHRFTNYFAPSAWKAERLLTNGRSARQRTLVERSPPVRKRLRSLGLESRATMGEKDRTLFLAGDYNVWGVWQFLWEAFAF